MKVKAKADETIKDLFDPAKNIYRSIEKVITYSASQESRLKAEITEYIATDSIEEQLEKLLSKMQLALDSGGENEVGVWVSGFYGSGKSSFTKYLGMALDESVTIDHKPFLTHLQDRLKKAQTKALLGTVAKRYPAAVVLLDLASEGLAGATMEDVSTVLFYKALQWAGYSRNLKVAALERRLRKDGRYQEFLDRIQADVGTPWSEIQNDPLVIDSLIPEIAHALYPALFRSTTAFSTEAADFKVFENERVKEMIDIVRETTGKDFIIFIIDEVGQYVGSRQNLILNLDGLAKNLKNIGQGKVWIVGTAQQTLTEDDPRAALNSPELYKLKDRFPIQIDLESSDIREICYRRLLGKSPAGDQVLGEKFDKHGPALRQNTKLQDARYYDSDFDKTTFVNLYPFLPAHFDLLLHLLGALAKSTGGIGLRSAIKVIQDVLVEGIDKQPPVADQPVGWLATTITLYDALEKDIRRAFPSIHKAVGKSLLRFPDSPLHQEVAKTVAVLQILGNMPITAQNVTSLMHPRIDAASRRDETDVAITELISDPLVPFGEDKNGNLCLFSEKLNDIDQERGQIPLRSAEARRILNEGIKESFNPLPSTRLHGTLAVTSGLRMQTGSMASSLAGERETIQTVVEFVAPDDFETARLRLIEESRQRAASNTIFLLGRSDKDADEKILEIYRCREIGQRYRNDPDEEVRDYCHAQSDRATKLAGELQQMLKTSLSQGSFIFRAESTAVDVLHQDVLEASKKYLADVAKQVFDRYSEADVRADTALAEKFLRIGNLKAVTAAVDPMSLVQVVGGTPRINTGHKALVSIHDYIDRSGTVDGKRLIDTFTEAPFGWSQDTLRYLIAALLVAGEIKLKVSGREVTSVGQQAIEALSTNNKFKTVGVLLRGEKLKPEVLARAAERLTDLVGDQVIPLENEISRAAAKQFPQFQHRFGPLVEKLGSLGLPGAETVRSLNQELADVMLTDASDAPQRLGAEDSALYANLRWAAEVESAFKNGLEGTIQDLQRHRQQIEALPNSGVPGELKDDLADDLLQLGERLSQTTFYKHAADLNCQLTAIKTRTSEAARQMVDSLKGSLKEAQLDLQRLPEWSELTQEEQSKSLSSLDDLVSPAPEDLRGFKQLLNQEHEVFTRVRDLKKSVESLGDSRRLEREREAARLRQEAMAQAKQAGKATLKRELNLPKVVTQASELDQVIGQLQTVKEEIAGYTDIEVTLKLNQD